MKTSLKNLVLALSIVASSAYAQDINPLKYTATNKGKIFVSWGGNRETFSKSDIHFEGENYDFTIKDATAKDKPKGWHIDYINPTRMTIPQTNFKLGYFISEHYTISFGLDHMKYVMEREQTRVLDGYIDLPVKGYIDSPIEGEGYQFNGTYNNEPTYLSADFLSFEHTDGLNYIHAEIARVDDISSFLGLPNTDKFQINLSEGVSAGVLFPKTNSTLLLMDRNDDFHIAGYGVSARAGINFTFFKYFFMQLDLKGGYINMPDIRTTPNPVDRASQHFTYLQRVIAFGGIFRI
ncbi:hypothetical protein ACFFU1_05735 [Algibacter miyuki]|uniref:Outer membrane protein beta-barrel domain-containing protein n=1 Tax=Algibacter miyuki TaxID=1306933 RepID=A0ABV5GY26_9FLAO|nr:hypothetical protein [Algibacter miyuki]MDN3665911.1 hypothetical protein [Algibacter miyuki]